MSETKTAAMVVVALVIGLVIGLFIPFGQVAPASITTKAETVTAPASTVTVVETRSPSLVSEMLTTTIMKTETSTEKATVSELTTATVTKTAVATSTIMTTIKITAEPIPPIEVISASFWRDKYGWWHLTAEFQYVGTTPLGYLEICWTLYDADGKIVYSEIWWNGNVQPGQKIADDRYVTEDYVNERAVYYSLSYEWSGSLRPVPP